MHIWVIEYQTPCGNWRPTWDHYTTRREARFGCYDRIQTERNNVLYRVRKYTRG